MTMIGLVLLAISWLSIRVCMQITGEIWSVITVLIAGGCLIVGLFLSPPPVLTTALFIALFIERFIPWLFPIPRSNPRS